MLYGICCQAIFGFNARVLALAGGKLEPSSTRTVAGIPLQLGPAICLLPSSRPTVGEALKRFKVRGTPTLSHDLTCFSHHHFTSVLLFVLHPTSSTAQGDISISSRSTLLIEGDVWLESLNLDGSLSIRAGPGYEIHTLTMLQ